MIVSLKEQHGDVQLPSGDIVAFGSLAHIKDLEKSIRDLERHRDAQRRGSEARATYARAIARLRLQLKRAQTTNEKHAPVT